MMADNNSLLGPVKTLEERAVEIKAAEAELRETVQLVNNLLSKKHKIEYHIQSLLFYRDVATNNYKGKPVSDHQIQQDTLEAMQKRRDLRASRHDPIEAEQEK